MCTFVSKFGAGSAVSGAQGTFVWRDWVQGPQIRHLNKDANGWRKSLIRLCESKRKGASGKEYLNKLLFKFLKLK